jgi:hypothetical protein
MDANENALIVEFQVREMDGVKYLWSSRARHADCAHFKTSLTIAALPRRCEAGRIGLSSPS